LFLLYKPTCLRHTYTGRGGCAKFRALNGIRCDCDCIILPSRDMRRTPRQKTPWICFSGRSGISTPNRARKPKAGSTSYGSLCLTRCSVFLKGLQNAKACALHTYALPPLYYTTESWYNTRLNKLGLCLAVRRVLHPLGDAGIRWRVSPHIGQSSRSTECQRKRRTSPFAPNADIVRRRCA
jgi:hypothetical protein